MKYRKLKKYKYQVMETIEIDLPCDFGYLKETFWVRLVGNKLTITKGYCWDGSTCTVDKKSMIASLAHDAIYQLIRLKKLAKKYVKLADKVYRYMCIKEKLPKWRANVRYRVLRLINGRQIKYGYPQDKIYEVNL